MTEMQSLIFYITCFSLSAFLIYLGSLPKYDGIKLSLFGRIKINILTSIGLALPILVGGLLYDVGIDYSGYISLFEKSNALDYSSFVASNGFWTVEPSFYFISRMSMLISNSSWLMFLTYSAINIIFFYLFLKRIIPKQRAIGFFIYLMVYYLFTMTLMRQGVAISICLYSVAFLLEKKYIKYLIMIAVASIFHFSALFFIITLPLFLLIKPGRTNRKLLLMLTAAGLFIMTSPVLIQLITSIPPFDKYVYLLSKDRGEILIGWTFLLQAGIVGLISIMYYKLSRRYTHAAQLYSMLLVGIIAYSLDFRINYASRLSYYFLPVSSVLMVYLANFFKNNRILILIILLASVTYFIQIYYIGNTLKVFPYNFIGSV